MVVEMLLSDMPDAGYKWIGDDAPASTASSATGRRGSTSQCGPN